MKRSGNRLVLLVGIFLAVVAFVLIVVSFQNGGTGGPRTSAPPDASVVVAAKDLPLGTKITADAVTTKTVKAGDKPGDSYSDPSMVIGQTVRTDVTNGQLITSVVLTGSAGSIADIKVPVGYVGIAVQVDQITGVGTLIKPGDHVDVVTVITGADKIPLVVLGSPSAAPPARATAAPGGSPAPSAATGFVANGLPYNSTTVKTIVEGLQVIGTLLPPPTAAASAEPGASGGTTTSLNGQQEIVILAATPQQAEAIKFSQTDGIISLVLRATADCQAKDGTASPCPIIPTTGVTLRKMVDDFGVLPPQIIQVLMPTPYPSPFPSRLYPSPTPNPSGSVAPGASTAP